MAAASHAPSCPPCTVTPAPCSPGRSLGRSPRRSPRKVRAALVVAEASGQVAFGAIYAQVKKKASRRISRSSRTSTSSRIRLATSPSQLPVVGLFTLATFSVLCTLIYIM
uniref:Uncharacterized protein n=1 Tax=Zea mays TaxID=4577 RepID=B6U3A8_MAIZE|nr:hypothetical protein [Zea mays]